MENDQAIIASVEVETDPAETWILGSAYGVSAAVRMGATIREGDIAVLFVQGKRKGNTNAIRMQPEALDRFCKAWLDHRMSL